MQLLIVETMRDFLAIEKKLDVQTDVLRSVLEEVRGHDEAIVSIRKQFAPKPTSAKRPGTRR